MPQFYLLDTISLSEQVFLLKSSKPFQSSFKRIFILSAFDDVFFVISSKQQGAHRPFEKRQLAGYQCIWRCLYLVIGFLYIHTVPRITVRTLYVYKGSSTSLLLFRTYWKHLLDKWYIYVMWVYCTLPIWLTFHSLNIWETSNFNFFVFRGFGYPWWHCGTWFCLPSATIFPFTSERTPLVRNTHARLILTRLPGVQYALLSSSV